MELYAFQYYKAKKKRKPQLLSQLLFVPNQLIYPGQD